MQLTDKFIILKRADVAAALNHVEMDMLQAVLSRVVRWRTAHGKSDSNFYVVINQDEPYFPDVLKLMASQMEAHQEWRPGPQEVK